jgi:5'-3' exonuclease
MNPLDYAPPVHLIVDGNNQIVTAAYGARGNASAAPAMVRERLAKMVDRLNPESVIVAFDSGECFRHEILPSYKSDRTRLAGIDVAIATAKKQLKKAGYQILVAPGFEADDIIATCAKDAVEAGAKAIMYSADKDLHQCILEGKINQCRKCEVKDNDALEFTWRTSKGLFVEFGVYPSQWVDWKCMVGDPTDKIPGVDHVGRETAARLLAACGSLDGFYANPWKAALSDRQHHAMINAKDRIPMLRELCTLRRDVVWEAL